MYLEYFYWQYIVAPRWLLQFYWTLHLALLRFFSVTFMLRTLFAHWRRDAVPYRALGLQAIFTTFAWNQISRGIGFLIRSIVLALWLGAEVSLIAVAGGFFIFFILAPLIILVSFAIGLTLLGASFSV